MPANVLEMFLILNAEAFKKGLGAAGASVKTMAGGATSAFAATKTKIAENLQAVKQYNAELGHQSGILQTLRSNVAALAGAYLGFQSVAGIVGMMKAAESAAFTLEASLRAANREFSNIGDANAWANAIDRLSGRLRIYSKSELQTAAAATVDMTKRLGLSREQMEMVIERTADLSAGKTDLQGGIERVTAALRGEAEASEYLGLTLNENYVKAWHEAHNASGTAWKDLTDLEKAQVRYNVFLEQASPLAGKAANSVKTMSGAYALAKAEIHDAVSENENATEAMTALATAIADNADEIGDLAAMIITAAAEVMKFVLAHKEVVITVGLLTAGTGALALGISSLTTIWRGLNGVMLLTTGSQMLPWLSSVVTALRGVQLAALSTSAAMGVAAGATLALIGGYSLGSKIAEWEYFRDVVKGNKDALAEVPAKFAAISQATGVTIRSFDDLNQAQKDGLIQFNQATGAWEKVTGAAQASATAQAQAQKKATDEMKAEYKRYADEVKRLQDDIANREQSLAEQLREMDRSVMSDSAAWKDRKAQAEEYAAAAKQAADESRKAFESGDKITGSAQAEKAVELYGKAKDAAADLNREVRDGDQVISTQKQNMEIAKALVNEYGQAAIGVQKEVEAAMTAAAQAANEQSGGQLAKEFPEIARQLGELKTKTVDLVDQSKMMDRAWANSWSEMLSNGKAAIQDLDGRLITLTQDRHMKIFITNVEEKSTGGLIGFMRGGLVQALAAGGSVVRNILAGGWLPGFGGGDTVPLLGERGEVMLNKYAVRAGGLRAALAFNAGQWDVVIDELLKRTGRDIHSLVGYHLGGLVGSMPAVQHLATGGPVTAPAAAPSGAGDVVTVNFNFGRKPIPGIFSRADSRALLADLRRWEMMSS